MTADLARDVEKLAGNAFCKLKILSRRVHDELNIILNIESILQIDYRRRRKQKTSIGSLIGNDKETILCSVILTILRASG
jgi:hypothetical protein